LGQARSSNAQPLLTHSHQRHQQLRSNPTGSEPGHANSRNKEDRGNRKCSRTRKSQNSDGCDNSSSVPPPTIPKPPPRERSKTHERHGRRHSGEKRAMCPRPFLTVLSWRPRRCARRGHAARVLPVFGRELDRAVLCHEGIRGERRISLTEQTRGRKNRQAHELSSVRVTTEKRCRLCSAAGAPHRMPCFRSSDNPGGTKPRNKVPVSTSASDAEDNVASRS
jgi:hypothetical protein